MVSLSNHQIKDVLFRLDLLQSQIASFQTFFSAASDDQDRIGKSGACHHTYTGEVAQTAPPATARHGCV